MPSIISWTIILSIGVTAISVWGLLTFAARRSLLDTMSRRHFGVTSGTFLFGWLVLACILGGSGLFQATPTRAFPALALGIVLLIVTGALLMSRSLSLKTVMEAIPLPWLVGVQLYRVLGFNFLLLSSLGRLPGEFALPAGWGDVMVGLAAPGVGYLLYKGYRWSCLAALGWNVVGILDLVVAVAMGFLSSPGPFQALALANPNMLITAFPLVLVPLYAVPLSILLHLAALRRLKVAVASSSQEDFKCSGQSRHGGLYPIAP